MAKYPHNIWENVEHSVMRENIIIPFEGPTLVFKSQTFVFLKFGLPFFFFFFFCPPAPYQIVLEAEKLFETC